MQPTILQPQKKILIFKLKFDFWQKSNVFYFFITNKFICVARIFKIVHFPFPLYAAWAMTFTH
jgi:hypothetical protein